MQRARIALPLALLLALLANGAAAKWQTGEAGVINMERVCQNGAVVSIVGVSDSGSDATRLVGARRHTNLAAQPEPDKAFGGDTPRPVADYGPNIVAAPAMRSLALISQPLIREVPIDRANSSPDFAQKYGVTVLLWASFQAPGTPVIFVYQRGDGADVGVAQEIVGDCLIAGNNKQTIPTSSLPGGDSGIPPAQRIYQIADWSPHGTLLRNERVLPPGTRFRASDLASLPLVYATRRTPAGDLLPLSVSGIDLVSRIGDRASNTASANNPAISSNGRYVAFESLASTLVPNDTNANVDIFVYDRQTAQTRRLSVTSAGAQANDSSTSAAISGDGRFVVFQSSASNLVGGDSNGVSDIFLHDRQTSQTSRLSVSTSGAQAQGDSTGPAISADGRYVAFVSSAANLAPGDTDGRRVIYLRDRQTSQTSRLSVGPGGAVANGDSDSPAISADGRYVAFRSDASNLLAGDTNGTSDVFVFDRQSGQLTRASLASGGAQALGNSGEPALSQSGRYIVFSSNASNLTPGGTGGVVAVYMRDRTTGQTTLVSKTSDGAAPNNTADYPSVSADGRFVSFQSSATNLVGYDNKSVQDIFRYDRQTNTTSCLSIGAQDEPADSFSASPAISADGRFTAFEGYANNLLPTPLDSAGDIYVAYHVTNSQTVGLPYRAYLPITRRR